MTANDALSFIPTMSEEQSTLVAALLAAGLAALGYVAKLIVEMIRAAADRRSVRIAKLVELDGLLRAVNAVYQTQNTLARRLQKSVETNQPDLGTRAAKGFEATFVAAYEKMTDPERELHGVIRSMSENALKPLNESILDWLDSDVYWKAPGGNRKKYQLAKTLAALDAHLHIWRAKYAYWMVNPVHSLVYLADEDHHGLKFPSEVDNLVQEILG